MNLSLLVHPCISFGWIKSHFHCRPLLDPHLFITSERRMCTNRPCPWVRVFDLKWLEPCRAPLSPGQSPVLQNTKIRLFLFARAIMRWNGIIRSPSTERLTSPYSVEQFIHSTMEFCLALCLLSCRVSRSDTTQLDCLVRSSPLPFLPFFSLPISVRFTYFFECLSSPRCTERQHRKGEEKERQWIKSFMVCWAWVFTSRKVKEKPWFSLYRGQMAHYPTLPVLERTRALAEGTHWRYTQTAVMSSVKRESRTNCLPSFSLNCLSCCFDFCRARRRRLALLA